MAHHTGAILQRDGKTFALVTRIPGGIVTPETLEKIAAVARKYQIPILKLTSGQRFMLIGMSENDLAPIYRDLGPIAEKETAPCVKYVQTCLGTDVCKYGAQDSIDTWSWNWRRDFTALPSLQNSSSGYPVVSGAVEKVIPVI